MCLKQKPGKSITEFCLNPVLNYYNYFRSDRGKEIIKAEWRAAGITETVNVIELNPFFSFY